MFLSDALEILGLRSPVLRLGPQSKSGEISVDYLEDRLFDDSGPR